MPPMRIRGSRVVFGVTSYRAPIAVVSTSWPPGRPTRRELLRRCLLANNKAGHRRRLSDA